MAAAWGAIFAPLAEDASEETIAAVACDVREALAGREPNNPTLQELKRHARGLRSDGGHVDPWRAHLALAQAGVDLRVVTGLALEPLGLGLDEPALELRTFAIVQRFLELSGPWTTSELASVRGAAWVAWYLTGASPDVADARAAASSAACVCDMLEPCGLLTRNNARKRRREAEALALAVPTSEDPFVADFDQAWSEAEASLAPVREAITMYVRGEDVRTPTAKIIASLASDEAETLVGWCRQAVSVGLMGALARDHRSLRYRDVVATRLCNQLHGVLAATPLSLVDQHPGFVFWRSVTVLARERQSAEASADLTTLLAAAAESGAWTRLAARDLGILATLAGTAAPGFVHRLALTSARHRRLSPRKLWQSLKALADHPGVGGTLTSCWSPNAGPLSTDDALTATRLCGAGELESASPEACRAFWERPEQALLCGDDAPPVARAGLALAAAAAQESNAGTSAPSAPRRGSRPRPLRRSLNIQRLMGRHGEQYLLVKLFGVLDGSIALLSEDDLFPRRFDQAEEIAVVERQLAALREAASRGDLATPQVESLRSALTALGSRPFWDHMADQVAGAAVELACYDPSLPWELLPAGDEPLSLVAPTFRKSSRRAAEAKSCRRLLVVIDPDEPGAEREAASIEDAWTGSTTILDSGSALAKALRDQSFDVLHIACHQGPSHDGTPALWLADGKLPVRQLVDWIHDRPPQVLFLHGCSTLRASHAGGSGQHLSFGSLEPLERSHARALVGTLWDVSPPDDTLTHTFYAALADGAMPAAAMHAARRACATMSAWSAYWPSYVIVSP